MGTAGEPAVAGSIRDARRSLYRQRILAAAEHEFAAAGFADTRVNAIAKTAEVSLATVYKTFAGKAEIWDALHADRMEALLAEVEPATNGVSSPLERLLAGVAAVALFLTRQDAYLELSIRAGAGWAGAESGHGVQRTVWGAGLDMIARGVEASVANGELRGIRPRVAAGMIASALQIWLSDWVSSGRDRAPDAVVGELVLHLRWMLAGPGNQD
ncbi:TetR/AcrR family transcriptional regulator [Amycolatopsis acidicola]|uniref:TetR/AcrR family transcriptional regulator n=1 Tax=Amycolatopsis acidicola TaxID=2596893 RepID=A0A5N0UYB8_9PSEU|nr:TetR/AcrR family transcriptional regulator [Amycolatopsis acidicola]KAA9156554.1 TetR/AcrR family transcriptional regulator [Amycolatopsis acidicola]